MTGASKPRHSYLLAATILAAAALVAASGCTGDGEDSPAAGVTSGSPSPTQDGEEVQARDGALAAYAGFREAQVAASTEPDPGGGELAQYTADPLLSQLKFDLTQKRDQGLVTTGRPAWNPEATSVNVSTRPFTATIEDCFDATGWDTINKATGESVAVPGQAKKYVVTAEAVLFDDGRWRIRSAQAHRDRPC